MNLYAVYIIKWLKLGRLCAKEPLVSIETGGIFDGDFRWFYPE